MLDVSEGWVALSGFEIRTGETAWDGSPARIRGPVRDNQGCVGTRRWGTRLDMWEGAPRGGVTIVTPDRALGEALATCLHRRDMDASCQAPDALPVALDGATLIVDLMHGDAQARVLSDDAVLAGRRVVLLDGSRAGLGTLLPPADHSPVPAVAELLGWDVGLEEFAARVAGGEGDRGRLVGSRVVTGPGLRVVLAEPRRLVREALAESLDAHPEVRVVASTDDLASTSLQLQRTGAPLLLLGPAWLDRLPELCRRVSALPSRPRILLLDHQPDEDHLLAAIEAGVDGYVIGAAGLAGLVGALQAMAREESVVPPAMLGPLLNRLIQRRRDAELAAERLRSLTSREREVLGLMGEGRDHHQIAAALVISPETARTHVQRILRKLDVHSRLEAVELAKRDGMAEQLQRALARSAS